MAGHPWQSGGSALADGRATGAGAYRQAFRNVERALSLAGANWSHVYHVNSFHVGGFPPAVNATMTRLFRKNMPDNAPIWTQIGVDALSFPKMRFEIRVTAHVS